MSINPSNLDYDKIGSMMANGEGCPASFFFKADRFSNFKYKIAYHKIAKYQEPKILALIQLVQYRVWGQTGDHRRVLGLPNATKGPFEINSRGRNDSAQGVCDNHRGWSLLACRGVAEATPLTDLQSAVEGNLPLISIGNESRIAVAYVLQQMYRAFIFSKGNVQVIWRAGCVAADIVDGHMPDSPTQQTILDRYCICQSEEERCAVGHYCMVDFQFCACTNLTRLPDGRMVCYHCPEHQNLAPDDIRNTTQKHLLRISDSAARRECIRRGFPYDRNLCAQMIAQLKNRIVDFKKGTFQDTYASTALEVRHRADATYGNVCLRALNRSARILSHFLEMSLDAANPIYRDEAGQCYIHHPRNVVFTILYFNKIKGTHLPIVLALFKAARFQWLREQNGEPRDEKF